MLETLKSDRDDALIGYTGFVGSTLLKQFKAGSLFRSTNISEIRGRVFERVVCCAAPAQKWMANRDPASDLKNLVELVANLQTIRCDRFILISTVDVFKNPFGIDECTAVEETHLHPYGRHRRLLEKFVEQSFPNHLIVRLPGLVGPGLRKNVIFDLLNDNNLEAIDSRGVFQFYPMVNLWHDIERALESGLDLIHLTAEPVSVAEVARLGFNRPFDRELPGAPAAYDMQSRHAALFGGAGTYQYNRRESIQAIRAYAQSEPRAVQAATGARA